VCAALVAAGLSVAGAAPASAHASLVGATPAPGSTVRVAPTTVTLRFDENVRTPSVVIVTGPDGRRADHGRATIVDNTVTVAVSVSGSGRYRVAYRVISADGHPVAAETSFTYHGTGAAAAPTTPSGASASPAAAPADHGSSGNPWVLGGVLAALLVAGALLLAGRRRQPPARDTGPDSPPPPDGSRTHP
jgi:methionine-rich copper-binding protein CopC